MRASQSLPLCTFGRKGGTERPLLAPFPVSLLVSILSSRCYSLFTVGGKRAGYGPRVGKRRRGEREVRVNVVVPSMPACDIPVRFMSDMAHIQGVGQPLCYSRFTVGR